MTDSPAGVFRDAAARARKELESICLDDISRLGISKTHSDFLGSHTVVTYPPLDALYSIDGENLFSELAFSPEVDAYIHIPFCEYPCTFCPYTTLNIKERNAPEKMFTYFDALKKEISTWGNKLHSQKARVRSLYVGGGTPFAVPLEQLEDILRHVQEALPFVPQPEICVETSPHATLQGDVKKKLDMLKAYGVTRMSIGIQTFDFEGLRDTARTLKGHGKDDEEDAVHVLLKSGIPNINVDMIQDLPLKSKSYLQRLKHDLLTIAGLKPHHITWYNMRLRPETAYAQRDLRMVSEEQSLHTRLTIWNFLEAIGYQILEGDRFALAKNFEDSFRKTRGSVETCLLGMGVSAYSHTPAVFFQNARVTGSTIRTDSQEAVQQYIAAVREKGHAIALGFTFTDDERLAGKLALGLKRGVQYGDLANIFELSTMCGPYLDKIMNPNEKLFKAGLLQMTEDGIIKFTRTGMLFENEICARFYTPVVRYLAHEKRGTLTPKIKHQCALYTHAQEIAGIIAEQSPYATDF